MNTNLSIDFIKENCQTIGQLKKRVDETVNFKSVARPTNKLNSSKEFLSPAISNEIPHSSLMPRTLNFTKLKQAKDNLETEKAFRELGVVML